MVDKVRVLGSAEREKRAEEAYAKVVAIFKRCQESGNWEPLYVLEHVVSIFKQANDLLRIPGKEE